MDHVKILSGRLKRTRLNSLKGENTRPTLSRTVESIFNILEHNNFTDHFSFNNQHVLDLFAGSGRLGLEALSKGAKSATFIEKNPEAIQVIQQNIHKCRVQEYTHIYQQDALTLNKSIIKFQPFSLIFCDAPYGKNYTHQTLETVIQHKLNAPNAIFCIETEKDLILDNINHLEHLDQRYYGITKISFYKYIE